LTSRHAVAAEKTESHFIEQYHRALSEFMTGNPRPALDLFSGRDDTTLANPFGPIALGPNQVRLAAEGAARHYQGGRAVGFEPFARFQTRDLAYLVEVERYEAKVGGSEELRFLALRVTSIFGREAEGWKLLHRHADPITTVRPAESVLPIDTDGT
jgi:ketosteroid isomerase-like protein